MDRCAHAPVNEKSYCGVERKYFAPKNAMLRFVARVLIAR